MTPFGHAPGLTNAEYHADPAISKSHLDVVARSPLHYWQAYINPDREPRAENPAFTLGSAIHGAVLEPDQFKRDFIVIPGDAPTKPTQRQREAKKPSSDTLAAIAWWDEFEAGLNGRTVLTADQERIALACRDSVYRNAEAAVLLRDARVEQSYFALDEEHGVRVKARPDCEPKGGGILDLKSTADASPDGFIKSVMNYRYHVQTPWYLDVLQSAGFEQCGRWWFLAVEKDPPYACAIYTLPAELIREGRRLARRDLATIVRARAAQQYPGYVAGITELQAPAWLSRRNGGDSPETDFG